MGSVSGISGGGGMYQSQGTPPDFSHLKELLEEYFKNPTEDNRARAGFEVVMLLNNRNIPIKPPHDHPRKVLYSINSELLDMKQLGDDLNKLRQEPSSPKIQEEIEAAEGKMTRLKMNIQKEAGELT